MTEQERKEYELWHYPLVESKTDDNTAEDNFILNYWYSYKQYEGNIG